MDHRSQRHERHRMEREHEKAEEARCEREEERQPRSLHPSWFRLLAAAMVLLVVLVWMLVV